MLSLYTFYFIYFVYLGFSTFNSKYYKQIGLTNSEIALVTSLPALIAMCFSAVWGSVSDRMRTKKVLIGINTGITGLIMFLVDRLSLWEMTGDKGWVAADTRFLPLLVLMSLVAVFSQSNIALAASISMEYTSGIGKRFGPVRMFGTIGYQVGCLAIGMIFKVSLRYLFTWQAAAGVLAAVSALTMPNVRGHQKKEERISPLAVLKEPRMRLLLIAILIGCCTTMFYQSFFGAYMEELGISNRISSIITWVSVALEIPMLFFAEKIMKRFTVWKWIAIGFVLNGIRWIGIYGAGLMHSAWLLILFQLLAVSSNACFEFFPQLYIGRIIAPELSSSAQTVLNLTSFGVARIFGGLLAGVLTSLTGYGPMFAFWGVVLLVAAVVFAPWFRKAEHTEAQGTP